MVYTKYRLCHGCRAQFTNRGSEINGVFYCEACSARRSSLRSVVTTRVPPYSVNTPIATTRVSSPVVNPPNRVASISFLTPRNEKIIVVVFIAFIIMCCFISIKSNTKSDRNNIAKTENQNKEIVQENVSVINPKPERAKLSDAQIKQGVQNYINGNFSKAYPVLKEAAEYDGEGEACFYYAQMLRRGKYVSRNLPEAIKYFKKAAQGYNSANNTLGVIYRDNFSGEKYEKLAFEYFTRGTEFSPPDLYAKINMAKCLSSGFGTKRDPQKAIDLFKEAISDDCAMNYNGLAKSCVNELREDAFIGIINTIEKYYEYDSLYTLTQLLTYEIEQEENRAYILFRYITTYIAYDTSYSIYDGMQAFQYKKGVCAAYADLFETMCKYVGINAKYTSGYGVIDGNYKRHAWNVVYLKTADKKIFCDPCWAAGGVTTDQKFIFNYDSKWWTTDESFFGQQHIPD